MLVFIHAPAVAQLFTNPITAFQDQPKFLMSLDNRRTHLEGDPTLLYGAYLGIGYADCIRLKFGICGLPWVSGNYALSDGSIRKHQLVFLNLGVEYDFWIRNRFRLISNLQSGYGYNYLQHLELSNVITKVSKDKILPIEMGVYFGYDILPFVRLKLGGGWRWVEPRFNYNLSGYYLKIGCNINSKKAWEFYSLRKEKSNLHQK